MSDPDLPTITISSNNGLGSPVRGPASGSSSAATTPRGESGVAISGHPHTPSDGIKSTQVKLLSHVENRPDKEALMKRNIIKAYEHTDPKLQGVMSSLIKTQTEDRLAAGLNKRRSVQELVAQGILMDQSKGTINVQLAQRALLKRMERDRLAQFLTTRPTLDELVKTKQNLMEDTMTWVRSATPSGAIPLPRNCLSEDSRVLTDAGFLFLDELKALPKPPRYACFNPATQSMEYHHGTLFEKEHADWPMVDFTPAICKKSGANEVPAGDDEDDEARSHTSLLVTTDHDMYVQFGTRKVGSDEDTWLHASEHAGGAAFNKVPASTLLAAACPCPVSNDDTADLCEHRRSSVRMLTCATSGVTRSADEVAELEAMLERDLHLRGHDQIHPFLELYGSWIGSQACDSTARLSGTIVLESRTREFLARDPGDAPCFGPWVLRLLDAQQLRLIINGVHRASGGSAVARGQHVVRTSSAIFRDQLVQACLQAGFTAFFTAASSMEPSSPAAAEWRVCFSDPHTPLGQRSSTVSFRRDRDVSSVSTYTGRVWCVTVPTGLIFVQRAWRDGKDGEVSSASRAVIVGNCHTMTSFPGSSKLYLLGGYGTGSTTNSDLLILDSSTDAWARPPVGGSIPCERYSHTCSALGNGKLVVFGGFSTNGVWLNDVYVLDTQVTQAFYTKPMPPPAMPAVSNTNSQHPSPSLHAFQHPSNQLLSPISHQQLHQNSPSTRSSLSSSSPPFQPAAHPSPAQYSSHNSPSQTPTAMPHPAQSTVSMLMWQQPLISGVPPLPRAAHSAVVVGERLFVFGGNDGATLFNDLHVLDTHTWTWSQPTTRGALPAPRAGHTMNLFNGRHIVLFGGGTANGPVNDLHVLDTGADDQGGELVWSKPKLVGTPPSPRAGHTSCCFVSGQLLVFGGGYHEKVFNDLHLFNFDTLVWSRPADTGTVPTPRAGHSASVLQSRIYVFAGGDAEHVYNDMHILDTAFLRLQHQQQQAAGQAQAQQKGSLEHLAMSSLSLGPGGSNTSRTKGKSQSAPSSPTRRTFGPTNGEMQLQPSNHHGLETSGDSNHHGLLSPTSGAIEVAKLLAQQSREREEADRVLLARVDSAVERVAQMLASAWSSVELAESDAHGRVQSSGSAPLPGGGEEALVNALLRTVRVHRHAQTRQLKEALGTAQDQVQIELAGIRALIAQRHGGADETQTQPQPQGASVFATLHSSSHGHQLPHSASVPQSPYSGNYSFGAPIMLGPGAHGPSYPYNHDGGSMLTMHRSSSADGSVDTNGVGAPHSHYTQQAQPRRSFSGFSAVRSQGMPGTLTVKAVSVVQQPQQSQQGQSSSALNSPLTSFVPMAPGPPGTPAKSARPRKRGGNKFKTKVAPDGSIIPTNSASSSHQGTPVLRPAAPPMGGLEGHHHAHVSITSVSSTSSSSTSGSNTTSSAATSPTNAGGEVEQTPPTRHLTPPTPGGSSSGSDTNAP